MAAREVKQPETPAVKDAALDQFMARLASEVGELYVYRIDPIGGRGTSKDIVGRFALADFNGPMDIAERWGGGRFLLELRDTRPQRKGRVIATEELRVEGDPIPAKWKAPAASQPGIQAAAQLEAQALAVAHGAGCRCPECDADGYLLRRLRRLERRLLKELAAQREQRTSPDPNAPTNLIELIRAAKDLFPAPPQLSADVLAKAVQQGIDLGKRTYRTAEKSVGDVISEQAPRVIGLVEMALQARGVPMGEKGGAVTASEPAAKAEMAPWVMPLVSEVRRGISQNDDPGFTADWIVRHVPPVVVEGFRREESEVMREIENRWAVGIPEISTERGKTWIREVLRELRGEEEEEEAAEA